MAAVTVNSQTRTVMGNKRVVVASVQVASSGDTWATGLTTIHSVTTNPSSAITHGSTVSGGTITFLNAVDTAVLVHAVGI